MSELWSRIAGSRHFDKLLLAIIFLVTLILCWYLIKKNDAGGDDMAFIVWAETQAAFVLGGLLGLIKGDTGHPPANTPETKP